jgi:hypothetical protein
MQAALDDHPGGQPQIDSMQYLTPTGHFPLSEILREEQLGRRPVVDKRATLPGNCFPFLAG